MFLVKLAAVGHISPAHFAASSGFLISRAKVCEFGNITIGKHAPEVRRCRTHCF